MYCKNCGKELSENSKFCNYCGGSQQNETVVASQTHDEPEVKSPFRSTKHMRKALKKNKNSSEKKKPGCFSIGIALCLLFVVAVCFMASMDEAKEENGNNSNNSVVESTTEAPIEITAKELIKAYQENEINASSKYKGKYLKITGYVDNVGQSDNLFMDDSYYIYVDYGNDYDFNDLSCRLNDESVEKAATLKPGDKIVITGRCEGFSVTSIDIYDCTIIK